MNYTENYQLNQWEKSDRVLMEDFNADNAKLDTALVVVQQQMEALKTANCYEKLLNITTAEETSQLDVDVSHIQFENYWQIFLYFDPRSTTSYYLLKLNGISSGYMVQGHGGASSNSNNNTDFCAVYQDTLLQFHPVTQGFVSASSFVISPSRGFGDIVSPVKWSELRSFNFCVPYADRVIPVGTHIALFAIKR